MRGPLPFPFHYELDGFVAVDPLAVPPSAYYPLSPVREPAVSSATAHAVESLPPLACADFVDAFVSRPDLPPPSAFIVH